jgi:hypothetical protein
MNSDIAPELATAKTALAQLEADMAKARDRLTRCQAGVQRCSCDVLTDQAADLADEIIAAD